MQEAVRLDTAQGATHMFFGVTCHQPRLSGSVNNIAKDHRNETNDFEQSHTLMHDIIFYIFMILELVVVMATTQPWLKSSHT